MDEKKTQIFFRKEISFGNLLTLLVWAIFVAIAFAQIRDNQENFQEEITALTANQQRMSDTITGQQQITAEQTALIQSIQQRLNRDEQQIDGNGH